MVEEALVRYVCEAPTKAPPKACAGKRRPPPRGLRIKKAEDQAEASLEQEVIRLRGLVASLRERSEPETRPKLDAEVQADVESQGHQNDSDAQEQLDSLHQEVGDKSRELRRSQETVRLLRSELKQQQEVSEQFRLQAEMLEEQLLLTRQRFKAEARACEERWASRSTSLSRARPSSAQISRKEFPQAGRGECSDEEEPCGRPPRRRAFCGE
ncbi:unnamed protein product [Effrenium voratum]|nr:unnamed protein product [Effrenium voratum]|mmetsp:Transcript_100199/g.238945  ORF Transcript_100199/g.238945 Transcript_100199/m.238945 type:complete len:212 (-) Transcript_100199:123-758(-)